MTENKIKVLIWGSGSIGSVFGGLLSLLTDLDITLLGRDPHIRILVISGLVFTQRNIKDIRILNLKGYSKLPEVTDPFDVIIVSCKARDNAISAKDLFEKKTIGDKTKLVILQNGVGNE